MDVWCCTSGRFSHDRDLVRVATEETDVVLDPFNSKPLVMKCCVGNTASCLHSRPAEEPQCPQTIIEDDMHDAVSSISLTRFDQTAYIAGVFCAHNIATSVDPTELLAPTFPKIRRTYQMTTGAPDR